MRVLKTLLQLAGVSAATLLAASPQAEAAPRCFPDEFMFGSATASYQVEGAYNESGRTPSIWDDFCREQPGMECADVADDFFHRYQADTELMVETGLQSFRFSVSWSRVMNWDPETRRMRPNAPGIAFYHDLLDSLLANNIVPILTLYHWDLPSELQTQLEPKGWLNPDLVGHFDEYAALMFREFGSKVNYWTTFNEPLSFVGLGYSTGIHAPGYTGSDTQAYTVSHNALVAHATAVQTFRQLKAQATGELGASARIGIVLNTNYYYPLDASNPKDVAAAERALEFDFGWFLQPIVSGDYPAVMREIAGERLPQFTPEEKELLRGSYDLFMMNHYASRMVTDCDSPTSKMDCASLAPGWPADKGVDDSHIVPGSRAGGVDSHGNNYCEAFTGYPPGYLEQIKWLHAHDPTADILLTENGWCGNDQVENMDQLWYFKSFVEQVYKAVVEEKIPVIGYTAWSFLDNYEWGSYGPRFGLYYVDFPSQTGSPEGYTPKPTDLQRIPRPAAKWFSKVAKTKCLDGWDELDAPVAKASTAAVGVKTTTQEVAATAEETTSPSVWGAGLLLCVVVAGVALVVARRSRRRGYESMPLTS